MIETKKCADCYEDKANSCYELTKVGTLMPICKNCQGVRVLRHALNYSRYFGKHYKSWG